MASSVRVLLAFLLLAPVLQGNGFQPVTYKTSHVCAVTGSTVDISCIYEYPYKLNHSDLVKSLWFNANRNLPNDLLSDPNYAGRVENSCGSSACKWETCKQTCTLTIKDLRSKDSATYTFRPITDQTITDPYGVQLSVTDLEVERSGYYLYCKPSCANFKKFIWYKDGKRQTTNERSIYLYPNYGSSYSCAVEGYERYHSPFWCNNNGYCRKVSYNARSMCALQGTTVDMKCTYSPTYETTSKYWYIWRDNEGPRDITQVNDLPRRFQYNERTIGTGTLRITGLRVTDSAEYRFTFTPSYGGNFQWRSPLPGTTLTVTGLRVEVTPVATVTEGESVTLRCVAGCPLTPEPSRYSWYLNRRRLEGSEYSERLLCLDDVAPRHAGNYSCAAAGNEAHGSPEETLTVHYAPRTPTVSRSGEMEEGSAGRLGCSSDAHPAANYTWSKVNTDHSSAVIGVGPQLGFHQIQLSNAGQYRCEARNALGTHFTHFDLDVKYGPRRISVGSSRSDEMEEGSSVTLSCSSDANPAAHYRWFKQSGDSAGEFGQNYTIANITSDLGGSYYCQARNAFGRENSTLLLVRVADWSSTSRTIAAVVPAALLITAIPFLVFLCPRVKKAFGKPPALEGRPYRHEESLHGPVYDNVLQLTNRRSPPAERGPPAPRGDLLYASVHIARPKHQEVPPDCAGSDVQSDATTEVLYSQVNFKRPKAEPEGASRGRAGEQ